MTSRFTSAISDFGSKISQKLTNTGDSSYFNNNPRNRSALQDLKEGLASSSHDKRISALKKIIALMSNGKDVSSLFPEVISCMQSNNIVQKKLVYIYIVNTSCNRPNVAILAVNTFRNDCQDPNPLIRALALRTMSSMQISKIVPYLTDPLKSGLVDSDPYVRRTAVLAVAKAYQTCPGTIINEGFYDKLSEKIRDQNAAVVSAAVAALQDIAIRSRNQVPLELRRDMVPPLLEAINGCSEWGQISIMEALALNYKPRTPREAQAIIDRCAPRLQHANSALVMAAIRVIVLLLPSTEVDASIMATHYEKLMPPLVSLLSSSPEIQFVALKAISTLIDTHPGVFKFEPSVFFYPYNEPSYVKRLKIECIVRLVTEDTARTIIGELRDYTHDMDPSVSRYAVTAIGRITTHFATASEQNKSMTDYCTDVLLEILETHDRGTKQEVLIHLQNVARANRNPTLLACIQSHCGDILQSDSQIVDNGLMSTRAAITNIYAIFCDDLESPTSILTSLYPENVEYSQYLRTSESYHSLISFLFRILTRHGRNQNNDSLVLRYIDRLLEETYITIDARDRTGLYLSLYKSNAQLLSNILDATMASTKPIPLYNEIKDPKHKKALIMGLGSVSNLHIGGPFDMDVLQDTVQEDESEEHVPLTRPAPTYPAPEPAEKSLPASNTVESSMDTVIPPPSVKTTLEFDNEWEGLTKGAFIHKWHAYSGHDSFSFGRFSSAGSCTFDQIKDILTGLGLKFVKDRREATFDALFFCGLIAKSKNEVIVIEVDIQKTGNGVKLSIRSMTQLDHIMNTLKTHLMEQIPGLSF